MTIRTYPKDAHGNTIFPRKLRRIEWFHGLWYYSYTVGGFEGYRKLFTRQKTAGVTLATWKWSDWHEEHGHLWQRRPGKPTRCVICRCPVLPWHRRWRDRALIRWAIIRGAMWWSR